MRLFKSFAFVILLGIVAAGLTMAGPAKATLINFDVDQAGFVAPLAGSGGAGEIEVNDQFASLGVLFRDLDFPGLGPIVRNTLFGGSLPNLMYSNDGAGSFDTFVRVELIFVDPLEISNPGFVNDISIFWTDAGLGATLTAFDINDVQIGQDATVTNFGDETLSLSGIGNIARVELIAASSTGLDDINFGPVTAFSVNSVPEPGTLALFGLGLVGLGVARRRRKAA